jgi:hypothetical protein
VTLIFENKFHVKNHSFRELGRQNYTRDKNEKKKKLIPLLNLKILCVFEFSRFFKGFQGFSRFFKVFKGFSRYSRVFKVS